MRFVTDFVLSCPIIISEVFLSVLMVYFFFFKQKTAYEMRISDWSSDVCSSDLKLMLADVQSSYGLARPFQGVGNFETEHQRNLVREVCAAVQTGRLIVVSGLVGSGKTHLLRRKIGRASWRERVCQYV